MISFAVLVLVLGYFFFRDRPVPQIAGIINQKRPGVVRVEAPRQVSVNVPFDIEVYVDSNNQNVNAVGFYMSFSPNHLQLMDMETGQSFCQFYPERKYDNSVGTITLACGSPHPGFAGEDRLLKLTFMPRLVANTALLIDPKSQILLSDGKGTNILDEFPSTQISILNTL